MVELKDESDVAISERHDIGIGQRRQVRGGNRHLTLIRPIQSAEDVEERAFSDTRRTHDGDHLACLDGQVEIAQHVQVVSTDRVAFDDPARFKK